MRPKILIVNWGTESSAYIFSEISRLKQFDIYLASTRHLPFLIKKHFSSENIILTNPYDRVCLCKDVSDFVSLHTIKFAAVTTFFEMNVAQTAYLAQKLDIPYFLPYQTAQLTSVNKEIMRTALMDKCIKQPRFFSFSSHHAEHAYERFIRTKMDMVLKPAHSGHSYGARFISKKTSKSDFISAVHWSLDDLKKCPDEWITFEDTGDIKYLLEEYVPGPTFSFDGCVGKRGDIRFVGACEFFSSSLPLLQQVGHISPPAHINSSQMKMGYSFTQKIIKEIGLSYCGFHCEVKYKKREPYLIEIAGRLPGAVVLETYQNLLPYNIFSLFFSLLLQNNTVVSTHKKHYRSQLYYCVRLENKYGIHFSTWKSPPSNPNYQFRLARKGRTFFIRPSHTLGKLIAIIMLSSKSLSSPQLYESFQKLNLHNFKKAWYV